MPFFSSSGSSKPREQTWFSCILYHLSHQHGPSKCLIVEYFLFWGDFEAFSLHYNNLIEKVFFHGSRASFCCLSKIPCLYKKEVVVLVIQSCSNLCDPIDCSLPRSSVHWILQASILEWVAIPFSRGSSQPKVSINFQRIILCDISSMY